MGGENGARRKAWQSNIFLQDPNPRHPIPHQKRVEKGKIYLVDDGGEARQRMPREEAEHAKMKDRRRNGANRMGWQEGVDRDKEHAQWLVREHPASDALRRKRECAEVGILREGRRHGLKDKGGCIHNAKPELRALLGSKITGHVRPHGIVDLVPVVWKDGVAGTPHKFGKSPMYVNMLREHAEVDKMLDEAGQGRYWCDRAAGWDPKSGFPRANPGVGMDKAKYPDGPTYRSRWPGKAKEFGRPQ